MTSELAIYKEEDSKRRPSATSALFHAICSIVEEAGAVIAVQRIRIESLEEKATIDALTGLHNKRGFFQAFSAELDRCNRDLSYGGLLVFIDLDNFKAIGNNYGTHAGDACLRLMSRTLLSEVREMDVAARLNNDEFVLLLSNATKKQAASRLQQFGWRLNNLALAWRGEIIPVRASLELREYRKGDSPKIIFSAADIALYGHESRQDRKAGIAVHH